MENALNAPTAVGSGVLGIHATDSQRLQKEEEEEGPDLQLQRPSNPFILRWLHLQQLQHHQQLQSLSFLLVPSQHLSVFFEMEIITIAMHWYMPAPCNEIHKHF